LPLIVLAALSIVGGYGKWFEHLVVKPELASFASAGTAALGATSEAAGHGEAAHKAHLMAMILSIGIAGLGILFSTSVYFWKRISADKIAERFKGVYNFLLNKWYFDELYAATVVFATMAISRVSAWFDRTIIDGVVNGVARVTVIGSWAAGWNDNKIVDGLVNWVARVIGWFGDTLREVQTGKVQAYILMALGAVVLLYVLQLAFA